jgi:mono/diheme cytochrome c family protein
MKFIAILVIVIVLVGAGIVAYAAATGLSSRAQPGAIETRVARAVRSWAIPRSARDRPNPVPASADAVEDGLAHFADHCATCHANDGSGNSEIGRGLYPRPPDMRTAVTQQLTDGELFYIIENGVRFTGMPAFGTGRAEDEDASWRLVRFIRHLPQLTPAEVDRMQSLNPQSPEAIREQIKEEEFLNGGSEP